MSSSTGGRGRHRTPPDGPPRGVRAGGRDSASTVVLDRPTGGRTASPPRRSALGTAVQVVGELLLTLGLVLVLLVVYEVWVTNLINAGAQHELSHQLDEQWVNRGPLGAQPRPGAGAAFARLYLPSLHLQYTVVEGTTQADLAEGPGHYPDSPLPGEAGNVAIAGHRVGRGAPFNDLDRLHSCDALVVETGSAWLVYRVLPYRDEVAGWADGPGRQPDCTGVAPPTGPYAGLVGQQVVLPTQTDVVAAVPGAAHVEPPPGKELALLTLTTCNPKFSARERLVVHALLTARYDKNPQFPGLRPNELQGM